MTQHAYQLYQGCDWCTYRYSVAQVYDLLDQLRDVTATLLSGEALPAALALPVCPLPHALLQDLCSDLAGAVDMAVADLAVTLQRHLPSRWLLVELRTLANQLPELVQHGQDDQDNLPNLADRAERIRALLHRLDG